MRKLLIALVAASSLAACSTTQVQQAEDLIAQVQADAALACKFVPEVATILAFINAGIATTVTTITAAVCAAVPPPASARYGAIHKAGAGLAPSNVGTIRGVPVTGWRTQ